MKQVFHRPPLFDLIIRFSPMGEGSAFPIKGVRLRITC